MTDPLSISMLHWIDPSIPDRVPQELPVTHDDLARADRLVFEKDRRRWLGFRAGLRSILSRHTGIPPLQLVFETTSHGKPCLPGSGLHFNLSHTDSLAVVIVSRSGPVGIDLEPLDRGSSLLDCEEHFCHPLERESLPAEVAARAAGLIGIWTAKEAALKALGSGLSEPPTGIRLDGDRWSGPPPGLDRLRLHRPEHPRLEGFAIAVAQDIEAPPPRWAD